VCTSFIQDLFVKIYSIYREPIINLKKRLDAMSENVVLVTGATTGIGYELSHLFGQEKKNLVLVARSKQKLEEVGEELKQKYGINVYIYPLDLALPDSPLNLYNFTQSKNLHVDVLINNAGFGIKGRVSEIPLNEELGMIQVNITSLVELTKRYLPNMIKEKKGKILNVASTASFQPGPFMSGYYASKAFVLHYSEGLAEEVADYGITVTALCPGPTITAFQLRAKMEETLLFKSPFTMTGKEVAQIGFDAMNSGRVVIISGIMNFILAQGTRLSPRFLVRKISALMNGNGKS
jgi:short-subunit dehydrogenase